MNTVIDFLQKLSADSGELTFVFDTGTEKFTFLSNKLHDFLGLEPSDLEMDSEKMVSFIHPEDKSFVFRSYTQMKNGQRHCNMEFRLYLQNEKFKWVQLRAYLDSEENGPLRLMGFVEDITERKEHEKSLHTVKEQKDIVLQILAHDLRAPLTNIRMSSSLLEHEPAVLENEDMQKLIGIIKTTCNDSLSLISEVLDVEYMVTRDTALKKVRTNLVERLENQLDVFRMKERKKEFNMHIKKPAVFAEVDLVRFMLITENILSNAYKFTGPDGVIDVSVEEKEESVLISVEDNGIGIPENLKPLIFDKFTKARREGVRGERPVGLGMHLIKTMVEMHGGRIWFESQEKTGTTFYVEIPK